MIFRRLRSSRPKLIALRVTAFAAGLLYVLATTDTIQILKDVAKATIAVVSAVPTQPLGTPKSKEVGNLNE